MLLIHLSSLLPVFMEFLCLCLFCSCYAVLSTLSIFFQISCFTLFIFFMSCDCEYSELFLVVPWVDRSFEFPWLRRVALLQLSSCRPSAALSHGTMR